MSKCLWRNGSGIEELKKEPFPSPAILWIVNVRERKPREKKKSCKYIGALNIPGIYKDLNDIFHDRCVTVFWICLGFWVCQGSKYARVTYDSE